ncbi:MAG: hypothetical protein ACRERV_06450 [Methylococcales bacterium]
MKQLTLTNPSYTFEVYFRLNPFVGDLAAHFGYTFSREKYVLPHSSIVLDKIEDLIRRLEENMLHAVLNNETARREFLIAPVITEVIIHTHSQVRVEYPLIVNEMLKGSLDYLLEGKRSFLVIEAKSGDLEQDFVQLAVELIALDQWIDEPELLLFGAVSVGSVWQFGILQRQEKRVIQDINLLRVPADVENLLRIMIAVLQGPC